MLHPDQGLGAGEARKGGWGGQKGCLGRKVPAGASLWQTENLWEVCFLCLWLPLSEFDSPLHGTATISGSSN